jgi:hypothetical protein
MNKAFIGSYGRALLGTVLTAIFVVAQSSQKLPFEFSAQDWYAVANAVWIAVVPVAMRYLNPKDSAFGINKSDAPSAD